MITRTELNSNTQRVSEECRFNRGSWAMLALASAILLYSLTLALHVARLPGDGWEFQFDPTQPESGYIFTAYYGRTTTPLQAGDALLAIEGQPIEQLFAQAFALQSPRPPNWQAGNRVEYTIQRDEREVTLDVPMVMVRHFPQVIWNYFSSPMGGVWLSLLTIPAMLAIGLVVFLQRPHYLPAQLLLLFSWSLSSSQLAIAPLSVAMLLDPIALFFAYTPVFISIWQLTILPVIVHLLLVFPVPKQPLRRHPRLILLALYLPAQIGPWLVFALNVGRPAAMTSAWNTVQTIHILVALVLMIASVVHTFRTVRDAAVRAQMRWVTFGVLFGFMSSLLGWSLITLSGASSDLLSLLSFLILLLPLSLAIAILRYRLFDIDFIIRQTLIYGVASALIALLYAGSVVSLQSLFRAIIGHTSDVAIAVSTLGIAALALPLRNRTQDAIDRRFYRQKYDAQKTLEAFVAGLQDKTDLAGLAAEVRAVIQETLQPASVKVWLVAEPTRAAAQPGTQDEITRLAPNDPIIARLQRARHVVEVEQLPSTSPALQTMQEERAVLAAPLINQGELIGLITLGPRRSEQGYASDDYQLLNLAGPRGARMPGGIPVISTGVLVIYSDDESFSFMTSEGHIFAGMIIFSAERQENKTVAQIQALVRANDPLYELLMRLGMSKYEDEFWLATLRNVAAHFDATGEPTQHTALIDPSVRWSEAKNIWHNAALRTMLYTLTEPLRWLRKKLQSS